MKEEEEERDYRDGEHTSGIESRVDMEEMRIGSVESPRRGVFQA
jgi:hypothetical protein